MKTNTVEQAKRLWELRIDTTPYLWIRIESPYVEKATSPACHFNDIIGPALTLDELYAVFDNIGLWITPRKTEWEVTTDSFDVMLDFPEFIKTTNHAADWTEILIWLIENKHVMVEQVNLALEGE